MIRRSESFASSATRGASLVRAFLVLVLAVIALALSACGGGGDEYEPPPDNGVPYRGAILPDALPKPDFTLLDTSGAFYDFAARTEGFVTLVYFGYTHCPDVCPGHMANIAAVLDRLPDDLSAQVKVVFVTVDPERDTAGRLREWLGLFDPSFVGLTADANSIDSAMQKALGELYFPIRREDLGNGDYSLSHAAFVLAYTPDNFAHTVYPEGMGREDWEHDLYRLTSAGWAPPEGLVQGLSSGEGTPIPSPSPSDERVGESAVAGASASRGPHRLQPDEAQPLLSAPFAAVTLDDVKESIASAFERHPDAARFASQGLIPGRERLDLEVRICGSRPEQAPTDSSLLACSTLGGCARLARILYDFYIQSGYEEFYQAALNVYNYVGTSLPNEAEAFFLVVRSELRVTGLPAN
jgi:protein SCO1/2